MVLRTDLSRDAIGDAALALVDRGGLRGLTIRKLAAELRVPPMTLYGRFDTKEALLDLAFERLLFRLFDTRNATTWQEELEAVCRHARETLLAHPTWLALTTRIAVPRWTLGAYDHLLGLVAKDGMSPKTAMTSLSAAMSFTLGSVLVERMMEATEATSSTSVPLRQLAIVRTLVDQPPRLYPRVARAAKNFEEWSFAGVFDTGLHALVAGIERQARRERRSG